MIKSSIRKVSITSGRINKFGANVVIIGLAILFLSTGISEIHKYLTGQVTSLAPLLSDYPFLLWGPVLVMIIGAILMMVIRREFTNGLLQINSDSLIFKYNQDIKVLEVEDLKEVQISYQNLINDLPKATLEIRTKDYREYVYLTDQQKWQEIEKVLIDIKQTGTELKIER